MEAVYLDPAKCHEVIRHLRGSLRVGRQQCPEKPIHGEPRCRQHTPLAGDYYMTADAKLALDCGYKNLLVTPAQEACARESEE